MCAHIQYICTIQNNECTWVQKALHTTALFQWQPLHNSTSCGHRCFHIHSSYIGWNRTLVIIMAGKVRDQRRCCKEVWLYTSVWEHYQGWCCEEVWWYTSVWEHYQGWCCKEVWLYTSVWEHFQGWCCEEVWLYTSVWEHYQGWCLTVRTALQGYRHMNTHCTYPSR